MINETAENTLDIMELQRKIKELEKRVDTVYEVVGICIYKDNEKNEMECDEYKLRFECCNCKFRFTPTYRIEGGMIKPRCPNCGSNIIKIY